MVGTTLNYWPKMGHAPKPYFLSPAGNGYRVSAATSDMALLMNYVFGRVHREVEKCHTLYGWRAGNNGINSYVQDTNHASATAWDYNGGRHLYEPPNPKAYASDVYGALGFSQTQINKIRAINAHVNKAAGKTILRWGGDFGMPTDPSGWRMRGWRDPMHWEIYGAHTGGRKVTAADISRAVVNLGLRKGSGSSGGGKVIKKGMRGKDVKHVQWIVGAEQDSVFGKDTVKKVKATQRRLKATGLYRGRIDGVWGPASDGAYNTFCDGKRGPMTIKQWQRNAKTTVDGIISRPSKLIRKCQKDHGTSASVQKAHQIRGKDIDGLEGPQFWKMQQDLMGFTGVDIDGKDGRKTWRANQRRIMRGRY